MEDATPRLQNGMQPEGSLTTAKEARKRAELDAQLLANRIALLKQEEEKAWKKIEETRKRAGDISTLRNENEQKYIAKEQSTSDLSDDDEVPVPPERARSGSLRG